MAIALNIDTVGGSNFENYDLRNVKTLHVGGFALAVATVEITGTLSVSGVVTLTNYGTGGVVSAGIADSGGVGFKLLRVPN